MPWHRLPKAVSTSIFYWPKSAELCEDLQCTQSDSGPVIAAYDLQFWKTRFKGSNKLKQILVLQSQQILSRSATLCCERGNSSLRFQWQSGGVRMAATRHNERLANLRFVFIFIASLIIQSLSYESIASLNYLISCIQPANVASWIVNYR